MLTAKVRWLSLALQDVDAIGNWLGEQKDQEASFRIVGLIWNAGQSLRSLPNRGRPGRVPGTRELVLENLPYFLAYRVRGDEVQILRVIHTSRTRLTEPMLGSRLD